MRSLVFTTTAATEKFTATADLLDGLKERFAYFAAPGKV